MTKRVRKFGRCVLISLGVGGLLASPGAAAQRVTPALQGDDATGRARDKSSGGAECGRFDGASAGAWEIRPTVGAAGGFSDYTPAGQAGIFYKSSYGDFYRHGGRGHAWVARATFPNSDDYYSGPAWIDGALYQVSLDEIWRYDIAANEWTALRGDVASAWGTLTTHDDAGVVYAVASDCRLIRYDPATGGVSYPVKIARHCYEPRVAWDACSGKLYVAPAYYGAGFFVVDPATWTVTPLAAHPEGEVNDIFCGDRSGHVFAGGSDGSASARTFWKYDIASDTWSRMPDLPSPKGNNGGCTVADDGYLYVYDGEGGPLVRIRLE